MQVSTTDLVVEDHDTTIFVDQRQYSQKLVRDFAASRWAHGEGADRNLRDGGAGKESTGTRQHDLLRFQTSTRKLGIR